jgi:hypothetical protein
VMPTVKVILAWTFAFASCLCITFVCGFIVRAAHLRFATLPFRHLLLGAAFAISLVGLLSVSAVIFGVAWWSVWKQGSLAKEWGVAASMLILLMWTPMIYFGWNTFWRFERAAWYTTAIGLEGLVVFLRAGGPGLGSERD